MGLQLLFCIESNKSAKTDWMYINRTIRHYFKLTPDVSTKPIPMGGKTNYRDRAVSAQIEKYRSAYSRNGNTVVIYCIDTDNYDNDPQRKKEFESIKKHCSGNGYELIWFCRDIEEVYWEERVESGDKIDRAKQFNRSDRIRQISEEALSSAIARKGKSNILNVLSKYLERL